MITDAVRSVASSGFSPAIQARINSDTQRLGTVQSAQQAAESKNQNPFEALVQQAKIGTSADKGYALRALDQLTGGSQLTNALLRGEVDLRKVPTKDVGRPSKDLSPRYDENSLYGPNGPQATDINQDNIGDCYFVATLAAVAQEDPSVINDAIQYDSETQSFNVRLFDDSGNPVTINVTQAEIADNVARNGGSQMDNTGNNNPSWPAVMETAYAKMHDTNHADGLNEGYGIIDGGKAWNAMRAITGDAGTTVRFDQGLFETQGHALDEVGNAVDQALESGQPVTLSTDPERDSRSLIDRILGKDVPQDALADNHVYSVESITKDKNGEWQVTLRNPWASNNGVGEGQDSPSATITVPLSELVETGGLEFIQIGQ